MSLKVNLFADYPLIKGKFNTLEYFLELHQVIDK